MQHRPFYSFALFVLGIPINILVYLFYLFKKKDDTYKGLTEQVRKELQEEDFWEKLIIRYEAQIIAKQNFFKAPINKSENTVLANKWAKERFEEEVADRVNTKLEEAGKEKETYTSYFSSLLGNYWFIALTFIPAILMYSLMYIYSNPYIKFIFNRIIMSMFVIFGVIFFVFTILYISPLDPAANILGETATVEQREKFNALYGLDQSYLAQLWNSMKGIITFDLGLSFEGNEDVGASIMNRFPVTLKLAVISTIIAMIVAIPIGIISATRPNSFLDYSFMFIALIGLSIPNFWQGLIFILTFAIKLQWLPATFNPTNWLSMIMPIVVLGTALTASVARMTRSSMLEIMHEDYMMTAKSKGLSNREVLWKHAIGNAMIPIITVIGLLFAGMLGGAAVTEKVFNISGIGSYIVDKQFIPDIPSIMAGVVYVAITISLINLIIDITYAFFDPRIRSKMKEY